MTSTSQLGSHEHHDFPMPLQYQPTPDAMEPTQSAAPRRTTDYGYTFTTPTTFQPTQRQDQGVDWWIQQPQHQTTQLYSGTEVQGSKRMVWWNEINYATDDNVHKSFFGGSAPTHQHVFCRSPAHAAPSDHYDFVVCLLCARRLFVFATSRRTQFQTPASWMCLLKYCWLPCRL